MDEWDYLQVERRGPLPAPVLARVKNLVRQECASFDDADDNGLKNFCVPRSKICVFFGDDTRHRCRYFENGVLPLDEVLLAAYCRIYSTDDRETGADGAAKKAAKEARRTLTLAAEAGKKRSATCSKMFTPKGRSARNCPACQRQIKLASRQAYRDRRKQNVAGD